jgi:hypothetical protein
MLCRAAFAKGRRSQAPSPLADRRLGRFVHSNSKTLFRLFLAPALPRRRSARPVCGRADSLVGRRMFVPALRAPAESATNALWESSPIEGRAKRAAGGGESYDSARRGRVWRAREGGQHWEACLPSSARHAQGKEKLVQIRRARYALGFQYGGRGCVRRALATWMGSG